MIIKHRITKNKYIRRNTIFLLMKNIDTKINITNFHLQKDVFINAKNEEQPQNK